MMCVLQEPGEFDYTGPQTGWVRLVEGAAVPMQRWTTEDTAAWLKHIGLPELTGVFDERQIDGPTLLNATPEDFERLNLSA